MDFLTGDIMGAILTIIISVVGAWLAMNSRLYEVEAKIRLLEAQILRDNKRNDEYYEQMKAHIQEANKVNESLIRIEGKLDLKQDRFK